MKLDLRQRCKRCTKLPRGKMQQANFDRYDPFCSFHCSEWYRLEEVQRYLRARDAFTSQRTSEPK